VHTHLVAGAFFSLAICLFLGALLSVGVHATGRRNVDFLMFAAAGTMVGLYAIGVGLVYAFGASAQVGLWGLGLRIARASALLAIAMNLLFALRFSQIRSERGLTWGIAVSAAVFGMLILRGPLDVAALRVDRLHVLGLEIDQAWAPVGWLPAGIMVVGPFVQFGACSLFGWSYLKGRREALPMFLGSAILGLAVLNDVLVALGLLRGLHVLPLGFVVFAFSVSLHFALRYSATRIELSKRVRELRERTNEIAQARLDLLDIQTELGRKEQLAVIGEMAAVIAHEVRNPLAVISNAVASLRRDGLCRHDHDVLLSILDEEAVRLNRLVTDLLAYARPVSVQLQRVVLHDLVQRAAALISSRTGARFEVQEHSTKGQVWADSNLLRQVFDNIIENAVQAMGGAGTVAVSVKPFAREGVDGFAVSVSDEGEGMDTVVRNRAKDPFFTTRPSGTGLGLAIVNRIVEAHGGDVAIDSRQGEGTTVTVFLPIGSESMPPPEMRRSLHPASDPPRSSATRVGLQF
jgi:signal transduction histidine kinase